MQGGELGALVAERLGHIVQGLIGDPMGVLVLGAAMPGLQIPHHEHVDLVR